MGIRQDAEELLGVMDVSVLCSLREGFSNVILESMAAGKPVVASRVGGNAESVLDGETGFLVEAEDSSDLSAKVLMLLRDPESRRTMGESARVRAHQHFSRKRMVREYEQIYCSLFLRKPSAKLLPISSR